MKKILLTISHEGTFRTEGYTAGNHASDSLSENELSRVESIADSFFAAPDLFITSPYGGSKQTAEMIAKRFFAVPVEVWDIYDICILNPKKHASLSEVQRKLVCDSFWDVCDPRFSEGDGAESFVDFVTRLEQVIQKIKDRHAQSIVMIASEQVIVGMEFLYKEDKFLPIQEKKLLDQIKVMKHFCPYIKSNKSPHAIVRDCTRYIDSSESDLEKNEKQKRIFV